MTRRLALTIVGVVVTTLLLAGAGTLALAVASARSTTEADLRGQAGRIAANIDDYLDVGEPIDTAEGQRLLRARLRLLSRLRDLLPVDEVVVLTSDVRGNLDVGELPSTIDLDDICLLYTSPSPRD